MISQKEFDKHLEEYHKKTFITGYLKEFVYGGIDGIVTTFAVVAGFSGAEILSENVATALPIATVLLFGLANLFADGLSMGIGDFLSSRAEKKLYEENLRKEQLEFINNPAYEYAETKFILKQKGVSLEDANTLLEIYKKYPEFWTEFMMQYELEMAPPDESPSKKAIATFTSFILFGLIPLLPYIFGLQTNKLFLISAISASIALVILGTLRSFFTKEKMVVSIAETFILGFLAGSVAYGVGLLFANKL